MGGDMAEPTAEERKKELAEAFRDGLKLFNSELEEERAKAEQEQKDKGGDKGDNSGGSRGFDFAGFLLGGSSGG